jgi:hypothetical protein
MRTVKLSEVSKELCTGWVLVKYDDNGLDLQEAIKIEYDLEEQIKNIGAPVMYENYIGSENINKESLLVSEIEFSYDIMCSVCGQKNIKRVYSVSNIELAYDRLYNNYCDAGEHKCDLERLGITGRRMIGFRNFEGLSDNLKLIIGTLNEHFK